MAKTRGFRKGQSTFICRACGKRTRDVNGGNGNVELCEFCDERAMAENTLSDHGYWGDCWGAFDDCKTVEDIYDRTTLIMEQIRQANSGNAPHAD